MSDVVATYGLDYGDYRKGLAAIEKTTASHFMQMSKTSMAAANAVGTSFKAILGGTAIRSGVRLATGAIKEFAEDSPEAARALEQVSKTAHEAGSKLGGELFYGLEQGIGGFHDLAMAATDAYLSIGDFAVRPWREAFGDSSLEELMALRSEDQESQKFSTFQKNEAVRRLEEQAAFAMASGKLNESAKFSELARHKAAGMQNGAIKYAPERDARKAAEDKLHATNMARIKKEASEQAIADRSREDDQLRQIELERKLAELEMWELTIGSLRLQRRDAEADAQQITLDYARKEAEIRADSRISDGRRGDLLSHNFYLRQQSLDLHRQQVEDERNNSLPIEDPAKESILRGMGAPSIESGYGGRTGLRAQVFGSRGSGREDSLNKRLIELGDRQLDVQQRIARNTERQGAVFA